MPQLEGEIVGQPATLFTGEGDNAVPRKEEKRAIGVSPDHEILRWRDVHYGQRCILIGNGESVKQVHLNEIPRSGDERVITIGLNRAWKLGSWDYHCMGDQGQLRAVEDEFPDLPRLEALKKLDPLFTTHASGRPVGTRIKGKVDDLKSFSFDALDGFYLNNTITAYGIQLAVWMGFTTIYLIGIDAHGRHFYGGPEVPQEKFANQRETFGLFAGILRHARPKLKIINLARNSRVRVFPKERFERVFG